MKQYEKLIDYIKQAAKEQQLRTGDKLPSIRTLSARFNVNKATVIRAYDALVEAHKAYVIPKSGYYWLERTPLSPHDQEIIDFTRLHPDSDILPYKAFEHCLNQAVGTYQRQLFQYGSTQGLPELIHTLKDHLADRQIFCQPEQVYMTSGSQQALAILSEMPMPKRAPEALGGADASKPPIWAQTQGGLLVEQPSYILFQTLAQTRGIPMAGFKRTPQGIDFKGLEALLKTGTYKCLYTMPRGHNPLGTSLSEKDQLKLLALANHYDVYIIEDDYIADLMPDGTHKPLHYYDTTGRVIYVKSFSKAFLPGIRLGAVVLPKPLIEPFAHYKRMQDLNTAVLSQGALDLFIASGLYDRHTKRARRHYEKKRLQIEPLLDQLRLQGVQIEPLTTGFLTSVTFEAGFPYKSFLAQATALGLKLTPSADFYLNPDEAPLGLRLCFAPLSLADIKKGLTLFSEALKRVRPRRF